MKRKQKGVNRMARGKAISRTDDIIIRLGIECKTPISTIAKELGRSRQTIYQRIERMKATGEFKQLMLDLGPAK
ncbi:hypothetical protein JI58_02295 [Marinosulfonomonas sp. PRT-SC04]|nr:hypothetical protein JI58_07375 [Marinosulfonomonas sp. PRT-SC04]KPU84703.1 hypothetical protein JI58_02295 [Marinosulfonomonas sp. PRT-SC04]